MCSYQFSSFIFFKHLQHEGIWRFSFAFIIFDLSKYLILISQIFSLVQRPDDFSIGKRMRCFGNAGSSSMTRELLEPIRSDSGFVNQFRQLIEMF